MGYGVYADIWPDEHVVSYRDTSFIENGQIEIGYEVLADCDVCPEITVKRRVDNKMIPNFSKQAFDYRSTLVSR